MIAVAQPTRDEPVESEKSISRTAINKIEQTPEGINNSETTTTTTWGITTTTTKTVVTEQSETVESKEIDKMSEVTKSTPGESSDLHSRSNESGDIQGTGQSDSNVQVEQHGDTTLGDKLRHEKQDVPDNNDEQGKISTFTYYRKIYIIIIITI